MKLINGSAKYKKQFNFFRKLFSIEFLGVIGGGEGLKTVIGAGGECGLYPDLRQLQQGLTLT